MSSIKEQLISSTITVSIGLLALGVYKLISKQIKQNKAPRSSSRASKAPVGRARSHSHESLTSRFTIEQYEAMAEEEEEMLEEEWYANDSYLDGCESTSSTANRRARPELSIKTSRMNDSDINVKLAVLLEHLKERTTHHLGYPYNLHFKSEGLVPFLQFSINNLGDPFNPSNYGVHSRDFEISVLNFFARLYEIETDKYWGYITTCGTEGNLLSVLYGREKFQHCGRNGVLYCSKETHYSVPKACAMYKIDIELIDTDETGEIDYKDLEAKLTKNSDRPAIVSLNYGTTVKGAYDTIDTAVDILARLGFERENYYIHVDGALNGIILPFLSENCEDKKISFKKNIDSISVSGHKMLGCPMPCGVVITRREHMERWAQDVEYLNSTDSTIMGSRNGQAALAMWVALQRKGLDGLRSDVIHCIDNANYLVELFKKDGVKAMLNEFSTTVVFERPPTDIELKWQLACTGDIAHVVVMPSVTKSKLRKFHKEVMAARKRVAEEKSEA